MFRKCFYADFDCRFLITRKHDTIRETAFSLVGDILSHRGQKIYRHVVGVVGKIENRISEETALTEVGQKPEAEHRYLVFVFSFSV